MDRNDGRCFAAILAGGAGTRFWPASRRANPKPFLDLFGAGPLVALTRERMVPVVGEEGLFFVLGESLIPALERCVGRATAIGEPIARNTLGAVLIALGHALAHDPEARLAILPADHMIGDLATYRKTMTSAFELARTHVVTLGVVPAYPETGYGYIHKGEPLPDSDAFLVREFVEKPDAETASGYVASGEYYWNAGIFVLPAQRFAVMAGNVDAYYAEVVEEVTRAVQGNALSAGLLSDLLEPLPNINIDKAVMEHCDELAVIPARFPWSDVGTWDAAFEQRDQKADNLVVGDARVTEGTGNVAVSTPGGPTVRVHGMDDAVVVATGDAVLVTRRGKGQEVGEVVNALRKAGRDELL